MRITNAMDLETGEIFENANVTTQEERENYKKWRDKQSEYERKRQEIDGKYKMYGGFVWLLYNANQVLEWGITPDVLTRLIFISTYMDYSNRLMLSSDDSMTKGDMQKILNISERSYYRFYEAVTSAGILDEGKDGYLYLNTSMFSRGAAKKDIDNNRMRLYINSVRSLYNQSKSTEHKFLSYLFQAIPFMNINYNILCFNATEADLKRIKPMLMKDYCAIIGYSPDNDRRLKTKLKQIKLHDLSVFSFVDNADGLFCYINPNVLYAGNKWDEVKVLGKFHKDNK